MQKPNMTEQIQKQSEESEQGAEGHKLQAALSVRLLIRF